MIDSGLTIKIASKYGDIAVPRQLHRSIGTAQAAANKATNSNQQHQGPPLWLATTQLNHGAYRLRRVFMAPPQAMTWLSMLFTAASW
jgi:hypothetical protein